MIALSGGAQGYALASNSGKDGAPRRTRGKPPAAAQKTRAGGAQSVRIIGGTWRGRRIRFPALAALRPTPDRVRETLFNWLQGVIGDARGLDLFAGSGALGLEALSRGAREVQFVEREPVAAAALRATLATLGGRGEVWVGDAFRFLARPATAFDVVFLDPPFAAGRLDELCTLLERGGWLAARAYVYLEAPARDGPPPLPSTWEVARETRAGEVRGLLARRTAADRERTDEA
ncbi:MAG: 16S rRNA (guanine(966)-N(2))-methyltransferase RsmD [Proteobacteria bacterium]|nr:16S rRNA (guanine(966)-N(2))-methyltransferase RsmD [Pseudomonadota bacterium]